MPLFEYQCQDCETGFEAFVTAERAPACPACQGVNLAKRLSSPGMVGVAGSTRREAGEQCAIPAVPGCGAGRCGCA